MNSRLRALFVILLVWAAIYLLAKLLRSKEISVAHLDSCIYFAWTCSAGERSNASGIFLRDRAGRPLADEELAASLSSCALRRTRRYARHLCGLGHSLCQKHNHACGGVQVVGSIHRPITKHRLQGFPLDSTYSAGSYLFSAMDSPLPIRSAFEISR